MASVYDSEYIIPFQAPITSQGAVPNCTAHACATAKQILEWKEHGRTQRYSIDWIYGNRDSSDWQGDGYDIENALRHLEEDGVPSYFSMPGNSYYAEAKQKVIDNYSSLIGEANLFRTSHYTIPYGWEPQILIETKESILSNNSIPILNIWAEWRTFNEFDYYADRETGIVSNYSSSSNEYHTLVIIGWKKINNEEYWICQNSWGDWWGDDGLCYIPFDHDSIWTPIIVYDAVSPAPQTPPPPPTNIIQDINQTTEDEAYFSWDSVPNAEKYGVYLFVGYYYNGFYKTVTANHASICFTGDLSKYLGANIRISSWNAISGEGDISNYIHISLKPKLPIIDNYTIYETSVYIDWSANDFDFFWIYYKKTSDSTWVSLGSISTSFYTFRNLSPNTSYDFRIKAVVVTSGGNLPSNPLDVTYTTLSDTTPPEVTITSPSNNSWFNGTTLTIQATATDESGIDYINFYNTTLGTITDNSSPYSATFDISSLPEGIHQFSVRAYDNAGNPSDTKYVNVQIDRTPPTVSITNVSKTSNSITLTVSGSDSGSGQNGFQFFLNDVVKETKYGSSTSYTFSNLSENTQYKVGVKAFDIVLNYSSQVYQYITTESSRPENWSWTTAEINAFNNNGAITTLTYLRWNAFVDRVNEFRQYKGLSAISSSAKMTSSDKVLTATRFNLVKNGIGSMYATGIADRSKGQPVLGSYFITLSNSLNNIT